MPIAYELRSERLRITPFRPDCAEEFRGLVQDNQAYLVPYMPFSVTPLSSLEQAELFASMFARFTKGDYTFQIRDRETNAPLGGCGLHPVDSLGRAAGYWIRQDRAGHGYAAEAASVLCRLAFEYEQVDRVELHIDPANLGSQRVAEKIGASREGLLRRRLPWPEEEPRDILIYSLFADDFATSPAAQVPMDAFDLIGDRIDPRATDDGESDS